MHEGSPQLRLVTTPVEAPPPSPHTAFTRALEDRARPIAEALTEPGTTVLLAGDAGVGKEQLAESAAAALETLVGNPVERLVIRALNELVHLGPRHKDSPPRYESDHMLAVLATEFDLDRLTVILLDIDTFDAHDAAVLEHLVRARRVRIICTARQVSGAADRISRNPEVFQFAIAPFTIAEADQLLAQLLGVEHISPQCLRDWHHATMGNPHALITLALASDRAGVIDRANRTAWVSPSNYIAPPEFVAQLGPLTPIEQSTLELIAYAAPLHEAALIRLLDADTVSELLRRRILNVRPEPHGGATLSTRLPIVSDAIRAQISPVRRAQLAALCFDALDSQALSTTFIGSGRLRIVRFGIDANAELPTEWLWLAMRESLHTDEFQLTLDLALAAMAHPEPSRAADAILRACEFAIFLGDSKAIARATTALTEALTDLEFLNQLADTVHTELHLTSIYITAIHRGDIDLALGELDRAHLKLAHLSINPLHAIETHRARILAMHGRLRDALLVTNSLHGSRDLETECLEVPAQVCAALVHAQRGTFTQALDLAQTAKQLTLLHNISPTASGGIENFAIFLAHWARGTTQAAQRTLFDIATPHNAGLTAANSRSGLVDLAVILFALQEGRLSDASALSERLLVALEHNDPFGALTLTQAAAALARAALGDKEGARTALIAAQHPQPGVSLALRGFVGILSLRARHWLRDADLYEHALELGSWARKEQLALIELQALGIAAHEIAAADPILVRRARILTSRVDQPIGDAILAHIQVLTHDGTGLEPEERLLSQLGVWLPLPPVEHLTGREREVALFTSLGYPSKYVATRLHLSTRTVETHLANVYSKLGLDGREELRHWFSTQREARS